MRALVGFLLLFVPLAAVAAWRRSLDFAPADTPADAVGLDAMLPDSILNALQSRGERNNNPGNIRKSPTRWQGEIVGTDPDFETFDTPANGLRALAKLLRNYQTVNGLHTVRAIISKYAPASENNTAAYIAAVARSLGVGPDQQIDLTDAAVLGALVTAVVNHENGRVLYSAAEISQAVQSA